MDFSSDGIVATPSGESTNPVLKGGTYSFTIELTTGTTGTPVLTLGGTTLTPDANGVYTVSGVSGAQTVTVDGLSFTVTVTFDANGGSGTMAAQSIIAGTATVLTANAFTREGCTFRGWSLSSSATTATWADKASVTMTGDATLYAVWGVTATFSATFLSGDISATFTNDKLGQMSNTATAVLTSLPSSQQTGGTYAWYFADNETPVSTAETCTFAYQSTSGANVITKNCVDNKAYQLVLTYTVDGITYSAFYQVSFRQKQ